MYNYFKSVLKVVKAKHLEALDGKSGVLKKSQKELMQIRDNVYRCFQNGQLTKEQFDELWKEFNRISFDNLSDQRKGKPIW